MAHDGLVTSMEQSEPGILMRTSSSHPLQVSPILVEETLHYPPSDPLPNGPTSLCLNPHQIAPALPEPYAQNFSSELFNAGHPSSRVPMDGGIAVSGPLHGNMFLSSCPGKQVRLGEVSTISSGPARPRCPVRRDLHIDLPRLADMGIKAIVCCLYDDEMLKIGVSFDRYREVALSVGIDILRIPMIEGSIPEDFHLLESILCEMHQRMTSGQHVLVHCRGGIGRAGLLACCYLLRFGWIASAELAIHTLRARRSKRAIETWAQVTFIAQYSNWIRREIALRNSVTNGITAILSHLQKSLSAGSLNTSVDVAGEQSSENLQLSFY